MTKMFKTPESKTMVTWNPFTGCNYHCTYCWARGLAEGKCKSAYPNGFVPEAHPDRYTKKFKPGDFVFVCSMGDISFAPVATLLAIHDNIANQPEVKFLFCTKQPIIYHEEYFHLDNAYIGCTIESNRDYGKSRACTPRRRLEIMREIARPHKFISIEPVMDFDLDIFTMWLKDVEPEIVEIGADNYGNNLPEPTSDKVRSLLGNLREFVPTVIEKQGLQRLI